MGVSSVLALVGIGIAWFFFLKNPKAADSVAASAAPVHTLLSNKYYVDELYDAIVVQPLKRVSESVLWKRVDAGLIDGIVNGTGTLVRGVERRAADDADRFHSHVCRVAVLRRRGRAGLLPVAVALGYLAPMTGCGSKRSKT